LNAFILVNSVGVDGAAISNGDLKESVLANAIGILLEVALVGLKKKKLFEL
jgi:hypothetical protein